MASSIAAGKRRAEDGGGRSNGDKRSKGARGDGRDRRGGQGGWRGKGKGKGGGATGPKLGGAGIFAAVTRGKERKAAFELIDILEEIAERIYPNVVLEDDDDEDKVASTSASRLGDDEDDLDAMMNGPAASTNENTNTDMQEQPSASKEKTTQSIEDQIAAELAELQGDKPRRANSQQNSSTATNKIRKPFVPVFVDMECVVFIKIRKPIDPNVMTYALLDEVQQSGLVRSHHVHKLTPVFESTRAELPRVVDMAAHIFANKVDNVPAPPKTYKIDARIRLHGQIAKMALIQEVAMRLAQMTREEGHDQPVATEQVEQTASTGLARLRVDLKNPDCVLHIEIYKNTAWIGLLHNVEKYCKLNPHSIAEKRQDGQSEEAEKAKRLE